MKHLYSCFFICIFMLAGAPLQGRAASQNDLARQCPQADKYRLQRSFYFAELKEVVKAPRDRDEVKIRFAELVSPDKLRRQAAIASLALAGNVDLFMRLLAQGDSDGMATYAANYLRDDGNLCIDSQIEEAVIRHFKDPLFSRAFLSFFDKNLYSSRAFFKTLTPLEFDANDPDRYGRLVKALCATRLAGLDDHFVEIGMAALPHDTPVQKRVMPGVHQSLIRYFASQQLPVFNYFRNVFAVEPRSEEIAFFQNSYAQTRVTLYQALAQYGEDESFSIFLEQLAELGREPWGPFFSNELPELISHLKTHGLFSARKDEVVPPFAGILASHSLPGQPGFLPPREIAGEPEFYDQQIRKQVYALLAEVDSAPAAGLLLDELTRLAKRPPSETRKVLVDSLLQALAALSAAAELDVGRLVQIAGHFPSVSEQLMLAKVMSCHPHPAGFAFVLAQLAKAFAGPKEVSVAPARLEAEAFLFDLLLRFSAPQYLRQTRAKIDALFVDGKLAEERYLLLSEAISGLLDEESPTYLALVESKKDKSEEKLRQEIAAAHARWRQEMADEFLRQGSQEMIGANIQILAKFGPAAKKAGYWLIRIGEPVLAQVHAALHDPAATSELKQQLVVVLGEIGHPSSIPVILEAVESEPDNIELLQEALLALIKIPQTSDAITFASSYLEKEGPNRARMAALAYFAELRDEHGLPWFRKFSTPDNPFGLRIVALYLGAMLGQAEVKGQLVEMLQQHENRGEQLLLLRGLVEITEVGEFENILAELQVPGGPDVEQIARYGEFRASSGAEKVELAEQLLIAKTPFYSGQAVEFLLSRGEFAILEKHLRHQGEHEMSLEMVLYMSAVAQRIFTESRRLGYRLEERGGKILFLYDN